MSIADFLPFSNEIEQAVLSALINPNNKFYDEILKLEDEDFYEAINKDIFHSAKDIVSKGHVLSYEQLFSQFKDHKLDSIHYNFEDYLKKIVSIPVNFDSLQNNLDKLRSLRIRREYYFHLESQKNSILDNEIDNEQMFSNAESFINTTTLKSFSEDIHSGSDLCSEEYSNIVKRRANPRNVFGISTGLEELDRLTKGFSSGDITIVGGRPSMGKSRLLLNLYLNAALKSGVPSMYFSLEMSRSQIYRCCIAILSNVSQNKLQSGYISDSEWELVNQANRMLLSSNIYVSDSRSTNLAKLRAQLRKMARVNGVKLFFVDYMQLLSDISMADNKVGISGEVVRQLRQSAQDLECHVVVGCQLNRSCEERKGNRPMMSDLRESGNIEEYADRIWLLYRDDYYNSNYSIKPNVLEVIVAKQRTDGETGNVELDFEKSTGIIQNKTIPTIMGFGIDMGENESY